MRWGVVGAVCWLAGCGGGTASVAPVEGTILFNGLPARASVVAQAIDERSQPVGRPSSADTRADGLYSLIYAENQPGALIGTHRVTVTVYPLERAPGELSFQERFRALKVVKLTRQVAAGETNHWNFVLNY